MPGVVGFPSPGSSPEPRVTLSGELATLPLVDSVLDLYETSKAQPYIGVGVKLMSWTCAVVSEQANSVFGDKVQAVNECAGSYVAAIKDQLPVLRQPTSEVVDHVSRQARKGANSLVQSLPGHMFMLGLDGVINASTFLLECAQKPLVTTRSSASPRKPTRFREGTENGKATSGKKAETKGTQTPSKNGESHSKVSDGILKKPKNKTSFRRTTEDVYLTLVVFPVKFTRKLLVKLRSSLNRLDDRKTRLSKSTGIMTPDKKSEIQSRRKVSPRKRIKSTLFGRINQTAKRFLGLGSKAISLTQADIRSYFYPDTSRSPASPEDSERKRKYDDIQTEDSDDSLGEFNMDEYRSDEDSDYQVPSGASTDSMEYEAGDTESDISFEDEMHKPSEIKDPSRRLRPTSSATGQISGSKIIGVESKTGQTKPTISSSQKPSSPQKAKPASPQKAKPSSPQKLKSSSIEQKLVPQGKSESSKSGNASTMKPFQGDKVDKENRNPAAKPGNSGFGRE